MTVLPVPESAVALGVDKSTLWRWIDQGCPVAKRGGKGRGNKTLVCVEAVRAWRAAPGREADLLSLASKIPDLLADSAAEAFKAAPDKRGAAWALAFSWQLSTQVVLEELRELDPEVGEVRAIPNAVAHLVKLGTK